MTGSTLLKRMLIGSKKGVKRRGVEGETVEKKENLPSENVWE